MSSWWGDSVGNSEGSGPGVNIDSSVGPGPQRFLRSAYVPPHLRGHPPPSDAPAAPPIISEIPSGPPRQPGNGVLPGGGRWGGGAGRDVRRPPFAGGRGGGWSNRTGGVDRGREREVNPFASDDVAKEPTFAEENTGINFDAYEDIPVETSGDNVPPPVNTFAEIDLGDALNANIRRCKYVKPTPVQRHAIPISVAGRDLMACAQTGSGKTAAFCFPVICGIMKGPPTQRPRGVRTAYPLALILSPTRELSVQVNLLFLEFVVPFWVLSLMLLLLLLAHCDILIP